MSEPVEIAPTIVAVALAESVASARTKQIEVERAELALKLVLPAHRFLADLALHFDL